MEVRFKDSWEDKVSLLSGTQMWMEKKSERESASVPEFIADGKDEYLGSEL